MLPAHWNMPLPPTSPSLPSFKNSVHVSGLVLTSPTLTAVSGAVTLGRISFQTSFPMPASRIFQHAIPEMLVGQDRGKSLLSSPRSLFSGAPPLGTLLPQSYSRSWLVALRPSESVPHPCTLISGQPPPSPPHAHLVPGHRHALVCGCGGDGFTRHNLIRDVVHSAANDRANLAAVTLRSTWVRAHARHRGSVWR